MTQPLRGRPSPGPRCWATALVATALLASVAGTAWAQEASDSTEIDIVVRPSGVTPVPVVTPPPPPGAPAQPPTADVPILLMPPVLGARLAPAPGTVSARIALVQPHGASDRPDDSVATLVVRDDRGTASGWDVGFSSIAPDGYWWAPTMLENQDDTIRRLLPPSGPSEQVDGITGGRTLGPVDSPLPVLVAERGSGSGVYQQQLIGVVPLIEIETDRGTVFVHIPFAP